MERKYFYARAVGSPQDVLRKITTTVVNAELAARIPLVKLEKNARGQFYVFLGVDDESPRIPGGLGRILQRLGIRFDEEYPLKPGQIKGMVQRQDIRIHGFNSLQYRRLEYADPGDPFEQSDAWQPQEASPEVCARSERLLHWVSARGEGTWEAFAQACAILRVADDRQEARSVFRRFNLLGHIDRSSDGSRWAASPAALVRFPDDPASGFLTGQRTESLIRVFEERWSLNEKRQTHYPGPPRIALGSSLPRDTNGGADLGVVEAGSTSIQLAHLLPDLNGWKDSLHSIPKLPIAAYDVKRWQRQGGFQACDTLYEQNGIWHGELGMYRLGRDGDGSSRTMTLFFDEPFNRWLRGDWYGLRFLALEADQEKVEAIHDSDSGELLIPASQRWPLLYERALTLASGLLPGRTANPEWLSYPRIPLDLARTLCRKLNVDLLEK